MARPQPRHRASVTGGASASAAAAVGHDHAKAAARRPSGPARAPAGPQPGRGAELGPNHWHGPGTVRAQSDSPAVQFSVRQRALRMSIRLLGIAGWTGPGPAAQAPLAATGRPTRRWLGPGMIARHDSESKAGPGYNE